MPRRVRSKTAYVSWTQIAGATGYRVYYGTTPQIYSYAQDFGVNTSSTPVPGLRAGTKYYFAAKAFNTNETSPFSNEVMYTP